MITGLRLSDNADRTITAQIHDVTTSDDHAVALLDTHATREGRMPDSDTAEVHHITDGKVSAHRACSDDTARIIEFYTWRPHPERRHRCRQVRSTQHQ